MTHDDWQLAAAALASLAAVLLGWPDKETKGLRLFIWYMCLAMVGACTVDLVLSLSTGL